MTILGSLVCEAETMERHGVTTLAQMKRMPPTRSADAGSRMKERSSEPSLSKERVTTRLIFNPMFTFSESPPRTDGFRLS
jgi:hypothetical protein